MKKALAIVNVQNDYFPDGGLPTWRPVKTASEIKKLLGKFRQDGKKVIHVAHHTTPEQQSFFPFLVKGTRGAEFHETVKSLDPEKVIFKEYSDGFHHIDLKEYLLSKQIDTVIIVGMMIHNCVNAITYSSTDEDSKSIVVAEAVNIMDQQIFGEMIPAETIWKSFLAGITFAYAKVKKYIIF
ncbi:Isochorismatase hydrolase [Rhizopus microsporus var. microsporus]|uniref:Isochorismatase hydrolase n=2 Tax=Rhizopus microsporus TaxID=58291 RepID=A0A2G4STY3_RHIZD|nr:Isochorismatase hydrolase [Rhizopus microsporus ATCC 52813]ORE11360.1 Isochorismatase hydrolase [Rhizopus microsporus var. microsporus]PHZ12247.1 Isochorismatase hydrolase [Rhizopus microsporus ATCC 52813]